MKKSSVIISITSLALVATSASANTTTTSGTQATANQSATTVKSAAPGLLDSMAITYTNYFYGPSVTAPGSATLPDPDAGTQKSTNDIFMKNYLGFEYKVNSDVKVGPIAYWKFRPVHGGKFIMGDPYVRATHGKAISAGNLNIAADARVVAPISDDSRNAQRRVGFASKQIATYEVPNSRLTLGLVTYLGTNLHGPVAAKQYAFETYAIPNVEYRISPTLAANLGWEFDAIQKRGDSITNWNAFGTYLDVGASWDISTNVNLSPYIEFYPTAQNSSLDTTTINAAFSWKLL